MWWFAATLRKGGYEGPNLHLLHSTMSGSSTYKQNSLPRSWHTSVLKLRVVSRRSHLRCCTLSHVVSSAVCLRFMSFFSGPLFSCLRAQWSDSGTEGSIVSSLVTVTKGVTASLRTYIVVSTGVAQAIWTIAHDRCGSCHGLPLRDSRFVFRVSVSHRWSPGRWCIKDVIDHRDDAQSARHGSVMHPTHSSPARRASTCSTW